MALCAATLCGCILVPAPVHRSQGPAPASRANVNADSAPRIVAGQTTRLDVLLTLGEPDGRGVEDQWFTYRSHQRRGGWHWGLIGVGISPAAPGTVIPIEEWDRVERLTVRFDGQGIVSGVSLEGTNCNFCVNVLKAGEATSAPPH